MIRYYGEYINENNKRTKISNMPSNDKVQKILFNVSEKINTIRMNNARIVLIVGLHKFKQLKALSLANNKIGGDFVLEQETQKVQSNSSSIDKLESLWYSHILDLFHERTMTIMQFYHDEKKYETILDVLALENDPENKSKIIDKFCINYEKTSSPIVSILNEHLENFDLEYNNIMVMPKLNELTLLKYLNLDNNQITSISGLDQLTLLEDLHLSHNKITLISGLNKLKNLKTLFLDHNKIIIISGLNELTQLEHLDLSNNFISLPSKCLNGDIILFAYELYELKQLRYLDLSHNYLSNFLDGIHEFKQLQYLDLSHNKIISFNEIDELWQLQYLNLSHNQISDIPFTIMNLINLTTFDFSGNDRCYVHPIIKRFLDRQQSNKSSNSTKVNIDIHDIDSSIRNGIYKLVCGSCENTKSDDIIDDDKIFNDIINDKTLDDIAKNSLIQYSNIDSVYYTLGISLKEVLCHIWKLRWSMDKHEKFKKVLNEEMKTCLCTCVACRLTRLITAINDFCNVIHVKMIDPFDKEKYIQRHDLYINDYW